jgi:hypothetical protein
MANYTIDSDGEPMLKVGQSLHCDTVAELASGTNSCHPVLLSLGHRDHWCIWVVGLKMKGRRISRMQGC